MKIISKTLVVLCVLFCFAGLAQAAPEMEGQNIVETVLAVNAEGPYAGSFDTLIAALLVAKPSVVKKLTKTGKNGVTVFGPTDDAFEDLELDPTNIGSLDQKTLTDILLYHITKGTLLAADVVALDEIKMLKGGFLLQDNATLTDNLDRDANIIVTDVEASNGVIHVIDAVVLPFEP